ncbi:hypothetical protein B0T25DRAFT_208210 [Lasiosphaeria hispida]|uniref:Uncharacterized protein n=1 Tax=Lasiosphaeria hispida TaxID=260671 RepID=A0AAJ0HIL2_9PEZI|nr:hypothetical protein B0T25DRAFT_208210 [Lasiosphaeria hispida]
MTTACRAAIATAICTAAVGSPAAKVSDVTDAVAIVIKHCAFFIARQSPGVAPAAAAAIAVAIANIANTCMARLPKPDELVDGAGLSAVHLMTHLPESTYRHAMVEVAYPTFSPLVYRVIRTMSATSAPAIACAIDSAVTSVTSAVAAARSGDCMLHTASTFADGAIRLTGILNHSITTLGGQNVQTLHK